MAAIVKEYPIAATPANVYNALTQQDEIALWWTNDLSVKPEVGSLAEIRFRQGEFIYQFEIAELQPAQKVYWLTRQGPSTGHWKGTTVTWQLTPLPNGTQLLFNHDGFAQADRRYEITRVWWEHFLASLKSYLETGKGSPGTPDWFVKDLLPQTESR